MKKTYCDLHTHSVYSDGTYTPTEIIERAEEIGLSAVALTDHNSVSGLAEFVKAAEGKKVQAVCGIEISTDYEEKELHILGLFLQPDMFEKLMPSIHEMLERRERSNVQLLAALNRAGYDVQYEEVKRRTQGKSFNRAHVAAVLTEKGYTESISDAFEKLLKPERGFYVGPKRLSALETVAFLKSLGATAVLAHPLISLTEEKLRKFLAEAKAYGLDGMETMYSGYDEKMTEKAKALALEYGLKESGGSDFHGENRPGVELGKGKGTLAVSMEFFEKLQACKGVCAR